MAAHTGLKNEYMEDEKDHNLMTWLLSYHLQVNITKDSGEGKETDAILDQCLQNRAWVLQV